MKGFVLLAVFLVAALFSTSAMAECANGTCSAKRDPARSVAVVASRTVSRSIVRSGAAVKKVASWRPVQNTARRVKSRRASRGCR